MEKKKIELSEEEYNALCVKKGLTSHNIGRPLDIQTFHDFEQKKDFYAEEFAEGSANLKNLLLLLWEKNITTVGCCRGHKTQDFIDESYIAFYMKMPLDLNFVQTLMESIAQNFGTCGKITFFDEGDKDDPKISVSFIHSKKESESQLQEKAELFFEKLCQLFADVLFTKHNKNYDKKLIKILLDQDLINAKIFLPKRIYLQGKAGIYLDYAKAIKVFPTQKENFDSLVCGNQKSFVIKTDKFF